MTKDDPVARRLAEVGQEFGHGFALELARIEAALDALGRPHDRLPPVIHVAGTNGKGSTCAFLRAIGEAAGLAVHVFTSPHLIRPNERIRLAGRLVADDAFISALDRVAATGVTLTYFEAVTAAAFVLFAETPADLLVLEVGLGGRFDATNVVAEPAVSVITPVDFDHMAFLGDTIDRIAHQKAGILKPNRPAVIGRQRPEAAAAILAEAESVGARPLARWGVEWDAYVENGRLIVQTADELLDLPQPALIGPHQTENAALAVMAARAWGDPRIDHAALQRGLASAIWPARMQRLKRGPLVQAAGASELWLDGGHNPHAAHALAVALSQLEARDPRPVALIVGMLATKDLEGFLGPLAAPGRPLFAVPVRASQAGRDPSALAEEARALGFEARSAPSLTHAVQSAAAVPGAPRILICGSLYLAGEALALADGVD